MTVLDEIESDVKAGRITAHEAATKQRRYSPRNYLERQLRLAEWAERFFLDDALITEVADFYLKEASKVR